MWVPIFKYAFSPCRFGFDHRNNNLRFLLLIILVKFFINLDESLSIERRSINNRFPLSRFLLIFVRLVEKGLITWNCYSTLSASRQHDGNWCPIDFLQIGELEYLLFIDFLYFGLRLTLRRGLLVGLVHEAFQLQLECSHLHVVGGKHGDRVEILHGLFVLPLLG